MNETKRNHYLPVHYLKAWEVNGEQIFQIDATVRDAFPKLIGIRHAGMERRLYSLEIERWFKDQVEEPAQPVIDKLRATQPVKRNELVPLVRYMLCQCVRSPLYRDHLKRYEPSRIIADLRASGIDPADYCYDQQRIESMIEERFGTLTINVSSETTRKCVADRGWIVVRLGNWGNFITADNPVCFWSGTRNHTPMGMIFPLTPKLALLGTARDRVRFRNFPVAYNENPFWVKYQRVGGQVAQYVNDTIASKAGRFLFGNDADTLATAVRPHS